MRWNELLIATILVALCAGFLWLHFWHGGAAAPPLDPPLLVGETLDGSLRLKDVGGEERVLVDWFGPRATVLYTWKVDCPCVEVVEPRLRALHGRFGTEAGVTWVGVVGEPEDRPEQVLEKMQGVSAFYRMLLDPEQVLVGRLGFDRATQVAVLDGGGRLRYRGAIDDDYTHPRRSFLEEALAAVLAGGEPGVVETSPVYGCEFSRPPSCLEPAPGPKADLPGPGTRPSGPTPAPSPGAVTGG